MKQDKINSFSTSTIICSLCCSSFYGIFSSYILNKSLNSSIISIILGFIISLLLSKIILSFFNINENKTFSKIIKSTYKRLNIFIIILSIISSLFAYILLTYRLTTFLTNEYLIETPKYLILIMIIITTYYTTSKGIETILRVSTISFYISTIIFLFDLFSLINQINIQNLLPLIDVNYKTIIINALIFSIYFLVPTTQILSIKKNQIVDKHKWNKYYYLMLTFSFIIILTSTITMIGVSGINIVTLFDYPVYSTLKRIHLFSFLDSLENVSILAWVYYILNASSMFLYFSFSTIKESFNLNNKKSKIINILMLILCFSIPNFIFLKNNYNESYDYIIIPIFIEGLMLLIVTFTLIKNKLK